MSVAAELLEPRFEPSDEQLAIQLSRAKAIVVEANAGAAKTTTLAFRIRRALENGVPPERILALTFTEPAVEALQLALASVGIPRRISVRLAVQTFDQFAASILYSVERRRVPRRRHPEDVAPEVLGAMRKTGASADSGFIERFLAATLRLKGTLARDEAIWNGERVSEDLADALGIELSHLRAFRAYEDLRYPPFDGVDAPRFRWHLDATYDLARLLADPEPTTYLNETPAWPRGLRLIVVDEMHDTNRAMYEILRRLLETNDGDFCGVGDVDQVIHSQFGADRQYMLAGVDLAGRRVRRYPLTATHRFARSLALVAGRFAGKAYSSAAEHASRVTVSSYGTASDAPCEQHLVEALKAWSREPGQTLSHTVVLLRHSWQSIRVENALLKAGISYTTRGFASYHLQPEVLLIRALLAIATGHYESLNSRRTRAELVRAVVFFCGIKLGHDLSAAESAEERLQVAIEAISADKESLSNFMNWQVLTLADPALVDRMQRAIEIARHGAGKADWFAPFLEALDLKTWVQRVFVERRRRADALKYFEGLKEAVQLYGTPLELFASMGDQEQGPRTSLNTQENASRLAIAQQRTLTLSLIPDVKGLEFPHVVLPFLEAGVFPAGPAASLREERNLFYVAITRARTQLTLLVSAGEPSSFPREAGVVKGA